MKHFIIIVLALGALSCSTSKDLAKICAEAYPCQGSMFVRDTIIHDTVEVGGWWTTITDSVPCPPSDTQVIVTAPRRVLVPVTKVAVTYQVRDTCYVRQDLAKLTALNNEIRTLKDLLNKSEQRVAGARPYKWITWGLLLLIVALLGYIITKAIKQKRA